MKQIGAAETPQMMSGSQINKSTRIWRIELYPENEMISSKSAFVTNSRQINHELRIWTMLICEKNQKRFLATKSSKKIAADIERWYCTTNHPRGTHLIRCYRCQVTMQRRLLIRICTKKNHIIWENNFMLHIVIVLLASGRGSFDKKILHPEIGNKQTYLRY